MKLSTLAVLLMLASPLVAESNKTIQIPKDSEIGRYEIHNAIDQEIRVIIKLDTKTGDTWLYTMQGGFRWVPITNHEAKQ